MFIKWDPSFEMGIEIIDSQHKRLVAYINDFYEANQSDFKKDVLVKLVLDLKKYAMIHFSTEEIYFQKYYYPGAERHINQYKTFIHKVNSIQDSIKTGQEINSQDVLDFFKNWILHHLKESDMELC